MDMAIERARIEAAIASLQFLLARSQKLDGRAYDCERSAVLGSVASSLSGSRDAMPQIVRLAEQWRAKDVSL